MRNVIFAAPFPLETTMRFARAAARLDNVRLLGLVQEPPRGDDAGLYGDIVHVPDALDARQLIAGALKLRERNGPIHRVLGILEPLQVQLAQVREALGVQGADAVTADLFRDKARMKDELRRHNLPCARHAVIKTWADAEGFAAAVGFPMVVKPPAGMGCKATWRIGNADELRSALQALHTSPDNPCVAEEFLRGREYSYETITIAGDVRMTSLTRYLPTPLEVMETPWIQWCVLLPRDMHTPEFDGAHELGVATVKALGLETGMTHMEWFLKPNGEAVFGEIGCRAPGAKLVDQMNYTHDIDLFREWARVVTHRKFEGKIDPKYNAAIIFKRAKGHGRITRIEGLDGFLRSYGQHVVEQKLLPVGAHRRDWKQTLISDGHIMLRHPEWDRAYELAFKAATDITMYAS